jgi:molecular chaperone HscB
MVAPSLCWQCGQPDVCVLVCPACKALQKPPSDFFEFFGLEEKLTLDPAGLQRRFYELSRQVHPDRYTLKSETERACSLEATSILNDGYRALRDPIKRARYVLKLHGFDIGEQRSNNVPPELLEEVFELNEALEEIRNGDESARPRLIEAEEKFRVLQEEIDEELERQFNAWDTSHEDEVLSRIRTVLNRRRYIENLLREVEKELAVAS